MAESKAEILTGAAVLAVALGFFVYAGQGTNVLVSATDRYEIKASFRSAEGVMVGTDVRLAGVKVGSVTRLDLNPQTFYADATLSVVNALQVPDDSTIAISSEGLLGGNFVEILPGGSLDNVAPGGEVEDTQGAVSVITLLMKFAGGGDASADGAAAPGATE